MARTITLRDANGVHTISVADDGVVRVGGGEPIATATRADGSLLVGRSHTAFAIASGETRWVFIDGDVFRFDVETRGTRRRGGSHHGSLSAPMPATVLRIHAQAGAEVKRGETLIILEAMKMELPIRASADGVVTAVHCREGELVQPGATLIEIDEAES